MSEQNTTHTPEATNVEAELAEQRADTLREYLADARASERAARIEADVLLGALREIDWLVDGREDVDEGQPNVFMNIGVVARVAIAKATGAQA